MRLVRGERGGKEEDSRWIRLCASLGDGTIRVISGRSEERETEEIGTHSCAMEKYQLLSGSRSAIVWTASSCQAR